MYFHFQCDSAALSRKVKQREPVLLSLRSCRYFFYYCFQGCGDDEWTVVDSSDGEVKTQLIGLTIKHHQSGLHFASTNCGNCFNNPQLPPRRSCRHMNMTSTQIIKTLHLHFINNKKVIKKVLQQHRYCLDVYHLSAAPRKIMLLRNHVRCFNRLLLFSIQYFV